MKAVSVELNKKFSKDDFEFIVGITEVEKDTPVLYKIGNRALEFDCRSQIRKDEINKIYYANFDKRNNLRCDGISVKVITVCEDVEVDYIIEEYKKKLLRFAKDEILNRMQLLNKVKDKLDEINIQ